MSGLRIIAPAPFAYERPHSTDEAVALLAGGDATVLAGGTDVVSLRAAGAIAARTLVDVKHVPELQALEIRPDGSVLVGAAVTLRTLGARAVPGLEAITDGARVVGAAQTRTRATLVGNLCRASPAGDTLCGLLVLDAIVHLRSAAGGGARSVPVREFFTGPGRTVREPSELVVAVEIPAPAGGSAYQRFTYRTSMDLAVVGVAASLRIEDDRCVAASIAIGAAAPTPRLVDDAAYALLGSAVDGAAIADAVAAVVAAASPIDDVRGTRRHRLRVIGVVAEDVLRAAAARARAGARL